jgi:predicted MPP superfamily phosphohydrolase
MRITEISSGGIDDFRSDRLFTRREVLKFLAGTGAYLAIESASFGWSLKEAQHIGIDVVRLEMPNFPPEWNGTVIVHFTDFHIGPDYQEFFSPMRAAKLAHDIRLQLQAIGADPAKTFIINTGDIVTSGGENGVTTKMKDVVSVHRHLAGIPVAGRFVVPGNHDEDHPMKSNLWEIMSSFGYLCTGFNSPGSIVHTRIPGTHVDMPYTLVAGADWSTHTDFYDSTDFIGPCSILMDPNIPTIFATHDASVVDLGTLGLEEAMANTLVAVGHSHGRQIADNLILQRMAANYTLRVRKGYHSKFVNGLYQLNGGLAAVYVNPGEGFSSETIVRTEPPKVLFYILSSPSE